MSGTRVYRRADYVWSSEIAYVVGLIASDGCLIKDGRHINITSKDGEIIDTVQAILGTNLIVPVKKSPYGSQAFSFQFSNVTLYKFLLSIGLTPAKSNTMSALKVPDVFYADFIRGYFDGDGTIYGYWDHRWKRSLMYYTGLASGSQNYLQWLQIANTRLLGTGPGRITKGRRVYKLTYAKADSRLLFTQMYYARHLPRLNRKYLKFLGFLHSDPYAKITPDARVLESVDRLA